MRSALEDLELDRLYVIHAGEARFPMHAKVEAVGAADLLETKLL